MLIPIEAAVLLPVVVVAAAASAAMMGCKTAKKLSTWKQQQQQQQCATESGLQEHQDIRHGCVTSNCLYCRCTTLQLVQCYWCLSCHGS
jgi:hypothetical protein